MIAHVRVPHFYVRALGVEAGSESKPLIVTDESRVIDATPAAMDLDLGPGTLLETTSVPNHVDQTDFELERFVDAQETFYNSAKEHFPIIENFRFGEIFCEVDETDRFAEWIESDPVDSPMVLAGATASSGWLARILSVRQSPGQYKILPDESHNMALRSVEADEIWGLGRDFRNHLRDAPVDSFAAIAELNETDRRKHFGSTSRAINRLLEGSDPKPLNPFSRPRSISQDVSFSDDENPTAEELRAELDSIVTRFRHQLDEVRCLTHQLELTLTTADNSTASCTYTFSNPTDQPDPLTVGLKTMLREITIPERLESATLRADNLVANVKTYHRRAQENHENLEIL